MSDRWTKHSAWLLRTGLFAIPPAAEPAQLRVQPCGCQDDGKIIHRFCREHGREWGKTALAAAEPAKTGESLGLSENLLVVPADPAPAKGPQPVEQWEEDARSWLLGAQRDRADGETHHPIDAPIEAVYRALYALHAERFARGQAESRLREVEAERDEALAAVRELKSARSRDACEVSEVRALHEEVANRLREVEAENAAMRCSAAEVAELNQPNLMREMALAIRMQDLEHERDEAHNHANRAQERAEQLEAERDAYCIAFGRTADETVDQHVAAIKRIIDRAEAEADACNDLRKHEEQTHAELGAILGTDTSLLDGARRLKADRDRWQQCHAQVVNGLEQARQGWKETEAENASLQQELAKEREIAVNDPAEERAERYAAEAVDLTRRLMAAEAERDALAIDASNLNEACGELEADKAALRQRVERLSEALTGLVDIVDAMRNDSSFKGVFLSAHVHGIKYTGPDISADLIRARAALAAETGEPK